ncbi:uncharacterized protein LOC123895749 [Trifolium pratense]|uniref:uncharacterized protein LOC123895749 n=1 Tax=Trifolium pratense TaxID=57577 RepID=UPI001E696564|nr:uncharacterized protein LOC123895749 [Trifolium pratense]
MASNETATVKCYCCGLMEECAPSYINHVRESYHGRWICGLCAEAVKEESLKSISTDEALKRHMNLIRTSTSSPPNKPTLDLILAVKHLLFRSLDSPRKQSLSYQTVGRSRSCFSTVNGTAQAETQPHARIVQGREIG